jgi:ATP/maltotriose-dependent transcriptional regulator MalT
VRRVAEQLAAVPTITAPWMTKWLATHQEELSIESPLLAADLVERAVTQGPADDPYREALLAALASVLFHMERDPNALASEARDSRGVYADDMPEIWCNRHSLLVAGFRNRDNQGDVRAALASVGGDEYRTAYTLQTLWLLCSVNRDHRQALSYIDQAIAAADGHDKLAVLRMELFDNRMFTLQNLDMLDEAGQTLVAAREVAAHHDLPTDPLLAAAIHHYWTGRWDDALTGLDTMTRDDPSVSFYGLRDPDEALLLLHGVAGLIAVRRDDDATATAHLEATEQYPPTTGAEWDSVDFLLAARSALAERAGDTEQALRALRPMLEPTSARMMLRHQWLPRFVRLAMAAGESELANEGLRVCAAEASREVHPARAFAAAQWCRGLVERDSSRVLNAGAHYRKVGRRMELASVLEDAAVLLGEAGDNDQAVVTLNEAIEIYTELLAHWDVRRAEQRLAAVGVSRTVRASAPRPESGWESLSPLEVQVATLAAAGYSDPHAVGQLALPRRNIQTHVASVLSKLDSPSKTEADDQQDRKQGQGT